MNKEAMRKLLEDCWDECLNTVQRQNSSGCEIDLYGAAGAYITSQLSAMEQGGGMRWVKASERLPEETGMYFVKSPTLGDHIIANISNIDDAKYYLKGCEWLDDSPSDGQDWISVEGGKKICYCGSLRFMEKFKEVEYQSVMDGNIALLPCCMFADIEREHGVTSEYKIKSDELHKRKIDICDEVYVLNVGGYIGDSTRSEIDYAVKIGKPVKYLEALPKPPSQ